ncbi:MAG: hypothetical protein LEGION0398_MBIBDBAK_01381 [Legionellaceae bacterium]
MQKTHLKILSYNIQAAMFSEPGYYRYITNSWQQILPHSRQLNNLNAIAKLIHHYDIVALQEVDGGSLRTGFINQVKYLAEQASFNYWHQQLNRNLGKIAQHSNGILSRFIPIKVLNYKLPGLMPGRGAIFFQLGNNHNPLIIVVAHLSLGARSQRLQLDFLYELLGEYQHVIVMGDLNCSIKQLSNCSLITKLGLIPANRSINTFPSWEPKRNIDHILVSPSISIEHVNILDIGYSDHLPISLSIHLPYGI